MLFRASSRFVRSFDRILHVFVCFERVTHCTHYHASSFACQTACAIFVYLLLVYKMSSIRLHMFCCLFSFAFVYVFQRALGKDACNNRNLDLLFCYVLGFLLFTFFFCLFGCVSVCVILVYFCVDVCDITKHLDSRRERSIGFVFFIRF